MTITVKVDVAQNCVIHLTNALSDDTQFDVYYSPKQDACHDHDFAQVSRNGTALVLSPKNTPLLLELAGTYRLENLSSDTEALISTMAVTGTNTKRGDVLRLG